ncbi:MAG: hypothetical protein E7371_00005, partial [Clostridiales bacterium]|nr:hypothetical protein [Clostridiales bacterium]
MNKKGIRVLSLFLGTLMAGFTVAASGCKGNNGDNSDSSSSSIPSGKRRDSIVIMTEELSGLFNPFYATSGADMDVVGMTQIGMLSTDKDGKTVAGEDQATVVLDYDYKIENEGKEDAKTVYTFVLKNGLKFSDGKPLTMNDVMFNIYEYLDPVYTGSSTMYSINIDGLYEYRYQQPESDTTDTSDLMAKQAASYASTRMMHLQSLYEKIGRENTGSETSYSATEAQMKEAINALTKVDKGYN